MNLNNNYDAILVVSFGGPESKEDVIPFLENVLRGRNVPRERLLTVAEHYYHFEGKSPINQQTRELIAALEAELQRHGPKLPIYWGNRNWHPLLAETLRKMQQDGIRRALAFVTSAYSSYSGCRQYREDIARALSEVGLSPPGSVAPEVEKPVSYTHLTLSIGTMFNHGVHIISGSAYDVNLEPLQGTTTYVVCPPSTAATAQSCSGQTIVLPNMDSGCLLYTSRCV